MKPVVGYLAAYGVTMVGDRFAEIALPVAVLAATGSPAAAGTVAAAVQVPGLVAAPFLGNRTDRTSRRTMLVLADAVRVAAFAGFAVLAATHTGGLIPYLVIGAVVGCGNVLFAIAGQAILPQLTSGLGRANAVVEAVDGTSLLVTPPVAGLVVAGLGVTWGLAANAVSYLVSGTLLRSLLPALRPPPRPPGPWPALTDRLQIALQLALMALSAHGAAVVLAILVLGRDQLGLSVVRIGFVLSAAGAGGIVASLVAARWPALRPGALAWSLLLACAAAVGLALAHGFWWAVVANGVLDGFVTTGFIASATLRQTHTPNAVLGRVGAVSALANNLARVVGVAGIGVVLGAYGGRVGVAVDAALLGIAGLAVAGISAGPPSATRSAPPAPR
ncbi:MAG TPA: MFS transporter [Pseudonocardiaceae bacterium]|jgi:predicted MFS family arabinose efflux permease